MQPSENSAETPLQLRSDFARQVQEALGQNVYLCYQCVRCAGGCPLNEFFDLQPHQVLRLIQFGQEEAVYQAQTPWLCAACQTCSTRCPQGLDIPAIMEWITRQARARGYQPAVRESHIFNEAALREIRLWGRLYEIGLMAEMKLRTRNWFGDLDLAVGMLRRKKLAFFPEVARPPRKPKPVAPNAHTVGYYPGCSLHSTAREYDASTRAVCQALGLTLVEPEGWVCCGSTAAHRQDPQAAYRLPIQNLRLIEQSGLRQVTMPCAACFNRHKTAVYLRRHPNELPDPALAELEYQDRVEVQTLIQTLRQHFDDAALRAKTVRPLAGLRLVAYYGCLLTRPPQVTEAANPENPTDMDELLRAVGAEVLDWSYKTVCCGASHSLSRPDIVYRLSKRLLDEARHAGADAIAVACPLCHMNLDARQTQMEMEEPMPVFYFTQLLALAFGLPEKAAALEKNLVDPRPLLRQRSILSPPAAD